MFKCAVHVQLSFKLQKVFSERVIDFSSIFKCAVHVQLSYHVQQVCCARATELGKSCIIKNLHFLEFSFGDKILI